MNDAFSCFKQIVASSKKFHSCSMKPSTDMGVSSDWVFSV